MEAAACCRPAVSSCRSLVLCVALCCVVLRRNTDALSRVAPAPRCAELFTNPVAPAALLLLCRLHIHCS